ncbi:Uncharacterized protein GBIM_17881 [Gryllus bimaculatus]|nr:Uncharacterized protein GBIM_17881 [Gryllus bimaculatus]
MLLSAYLFRKVHCFTSVTELYRWSSSLNYLKFIRKPMIFVNARDDPLVPEPLLQPIKEFACNSSHVLYLELAHGGHLGFYEGGLVYPNPVTWLDRTLVALIGSLALVHADSLLKKNIEFGPDSENSPQEADESDSSGVSEIGTSGGSTSGVVTNASSCTDTVSPHMHSVITSFSSDDTPHNEIIQISKSVDVISNPEGIAIAEEVSVSTLTPETCMGDSCSATYMLELERESHTAIINPQDMSIGSSLHHRTCASKSVGESICSTSMASE